MTAPDLPLEAAERLGPYYVYALVDPTDESVFYVGKGSKQRLLMHGREADLVVSEERRSAKSVVFVPSERWETSRAWTWTSSGTACRTRRHC